MEEIVLAIKIHDNDLARLLRLLFEDFGLHSVEALRLLNAAQQLLQMAEANNLSNYFVAGEGGTSLDIGAHLRLRRLPGGTLAGPLAGSDSPLSAKDGLP
ncbi:MAG TPA: hypothetical protein VLW65_17585 [Bryobacteraceae bacterium]|nr:hypothetical protein [Bryobacteraceae bacterium]